MLNKFFLIALTIAAYPILGMEQATKGKIIAADAWADRYCAQGFVGMPEIDHAQVQKLKKLVQEKKQDADIALDKNLAETYDWIAAVTWAEKNLLAKPFEKWTVQDLCTLNAIITAHTDKTNGKFRNSSAHWCLRELTTQELARYHKIITMIEEDVVPDRADQKWFKDDIAFCFPPVRDIAPLMENMLTQAQGVISLLKQQTILTGRNNIVNVVAWLHFQIVCIHPWNGANKRTSYLITLLVLAQFGKTVRPFPSRNAYVDCFIKNLRSLSATPLANLINACIA